jgi:hypothetical protein
MEKVFVPSVHLVRLHHLDEPHLEDREIPDVEFLSGRISRDRGSSST